MSTHKHPNGIGEAIARQERARLQRLITGTFVLLLVSAICAISAYFIAPISLTPPLPAGVTWVESSQIDPSNTLWVDARIQADYQAGHIPGAVHLSMDDWGNLFPAFAAVWRPGAHVVIYCRGGSCQSSHEVAVKLQQAIPGIKLSILKGGYPAWTGK